MAKLDKKHQEQTADADTGGFSPVEDGVYHLRLAAVDSERQGSAGPYWSWEFDIVGPEDSDFLGRKLWNNTSLSPQAAFKMKETYDAFGAEYDADTDDLCGSVVKAVVSTRVIAAGARKGEMGNQIDKLLPKDENFEAGDSVAATTVDDLL